jgi:hypothetical protein
MNIKNCKNCGDEFTGEKQLCPICEVEKSRNDRPKRNIDRIREMTVKELAEFLFPLTKRCGIDCDRCTLHNADCFSIGGLIKWLESEVSEN